MRNALVLTGLLMFSAIVLIAVRSTADVQDAAQAPMGDVRAQLIDEYRSIAGDEYGSGMRYYEYKDPQELLSEAKTPVPDDWMPARIPPDRMVLLLPREQLQWIGLPHPEDIDVLASTHLRLANLGVTYTVEPLDFKDTALKSTPVLAKAHGVPPAVVAAVQKRFGSQNSLEVAWNSITLTGNEPPKDDASLEDVFYRTTLARTHTGIPISRVCRRVSVGTRTVLMLIEKERLEDSTYICFIVFSDGERLYEVHLYGHRKGDDTNAQRPRLDATALTVARSVVESALKSSD